MDKMHKNLGLLIGLSLDLEKFWSINVDDYSIGLIGDYSKKTENHLISKGLERYSYAYELSNKTRKEYKIENVRVVLIVK
jgi:hypothetical protein